MNIVRPNVLKPSTGMGVSGNYRTVGYRAIRLTNPEFIEQFATDNGIQLGRWEEGLLRRAELKLLKGIDGFERYAAKFIKGGEKMFDFWTHNTVVNEGLNAILDGDLASAVYMGVTTGTPTPAAGDTMSSHAGWTESSDYDETPRQTWTTGAASSQARSNSTAITLTCTTGSTFGGAFLTSNSTKGGSTGTLFCVEAFTEGNKTLSAGESLAITYTLSAADA